MTMAQRTSALLLLTTLLGWTASQVAARPDITQDCQGANPDAILLERSHWYSYEAHITGRTAAVGSSDQDTKMDLKCSLKVQHSSDCAYTLEFETCSVKASSGTESERHAWLDEPNWTQFSEHPIAFTLRGCEVRSVLSHPDDPPNVVNLKKGFISALIIGNQKPPADGKTTSMNHRDVQGKFQLKLTTSGSQVFAHKDLGRNQLPSRPENQFSPFSVFWDMSFLQHLVNSSLDCVSRVEEHVLRKLQCYERHAGKVDSSYNTQYGLETGIRYEFILQESGTAKSNTGLQVDQLRQSDIAFEFDKSSHDPETGVGSDPTHAKHMLENILDAKQVDLDSIPNFLTLVELMRHLNDLQELTKEAERCPGGEQDCSRKQKGLSLYLDALVQCNRLPCLKALRALHSRKQVSKVFLEFAVFSWLRMPLTDHRYLDEFLEICKSGQSRFCWLGLGGLVHTHSQNHPEISDSLRNVVNTVSSILGESCGPKEVSFPPGVMGEQRPNYIITMLKTLGNMGEVTLKIQPDLLRKLLFCSKNAELSLSARVIALQSMQRLGPSMNSDVMNGVLAVLSDHSQSVDLRVSAYKALVNTRNLNQELPTMLTFFLKNDPSKQIKAFVATDLQQMRKREETKFWVALEQQLLSAGVNLDALSEVDPRSTSHVSYHEETTSLLSGLLPEELTTFGSHVLTQTVFGGFSAIPESVTANLNLTVFGQMMEFMEAGVLMSGLDSASVRTVAAIQGMAGKANFMQYLALFMQQLSGKIPHGRKQKAPPPPVLLNQKWEEKLDSIYQTYQESHAQHMAPHLLLYLRMFGLDLDYTTLPDVLGGIQRILQRSRPNKPSPDADHPFSATHVINFLEAEYVFPTLMGAPLKWRTNFTLAVSLDAKLDVNVKEQSGSLHLKPILAATMLNQMVFGIPGVTEMGIHCKNSLYSDTEWNIEASGANLPFRFRLLTPKTKQRPLELYRNNYMLRGSELIELGDWEADRLENHVCLGAKFIKATGMRVCYDSSYLNVKHRDDKPFYLLAGRASWALSAEMEDQGVTAYQLDIDFPPKSKEQFSLYITANGKGSVWRREVPLKLSLNKATGDFSLDLKHSDFPEFSFLVSRERLKEGEEFIGYKSSILLNEEQGQWQLVYTKSDKKEVREEKPMSRNESPRNQNWETRVEEKLVHLLTPFNDYSFKLKLHRQHHTGNLKVDSTLAYENLVPEHNWLKRIVPNIFWEGDKKAWMEFRGDWKFAAPKDEKHKDRHQYHRHSKSHLSIPHTVIEVLTHHMQKPKHSMYCFNVSKVERDSGKLLLFANMTYNVWRKSEAGKGLNVIRSANLTMARHSWNLEARTQGSIQTASEGETTVTYVLTGEKMLPKDPNQDANYIGWWSPESASRFDARHWQVNYMQTLRRRPVAESDLPSESRKEIQDDLSAEKNSDEEQLFVHGGRVRNEAIHADVSLQYPFGDKTENLTFKGTFQWNGKISPSYQIFLKTFTLSSTLHSMQLNSQSIWSKSGKEKLVLTHQSSFTDTLTQRNYGIYNLLFRKQVDAESCTGVLLNHSISAHWLNFASTVVGSCKPGKPKARLYDIHIKADHVYWKELNYNVDQIFDLDQPGSESMNLTSSTMDIKVTGDWDQNHYNKKAYFDSKTDLMPSTLWELSSNRKGDVTINISAPGQELEKLFFKRIMNERNDQFEFQIKHIDKSSGGIIHEDGHVKARLINDNTIELKGGWKPELGSHLFLWLAKFSQNTFHRISSKLNDPNHEFNQNLKDYLNGGTVLQYLSALRKKMCDKSKEWFRNVVEVAITFESFYGPSFKIVSNTASEINALKERIENALAESELGWAWDYFEVDRYLRYAKRYRPKFGISGDNFTVTAELPYTWKKFNQLPSPNLGLVTRYLLNMYSLPATKSRKAHEKVAMIFGPSHVLTFDGRTYSFPEYPSESCVTLLAQDMRGKTFSVLSDKDSLYLIFPEMAVTMHGSGRVYINQSKDESPTPVNSLNRRVRVSRIGNILRAENPYLRVDCDTDNELCLLVLHPMLSGGVVGLLGNADGEKHNDFIGPNDEVVSRVSELASLYEISGECRNFADKPLTAAEDTQATKRCDRLLKQPSVTRCLAAAEVSEADLRDTCVSDYYREGCPCTTSKALAALCAHDGHALDRCQFQRRPEGSTPVPNQHDSWLIRGTHQLQCVLVIEGHGSVMGGGSAQAYKGLETLLDNVDEAFTSNGGFTSITYALIAFGGDREGDPHMHTQHRSPWMLQRDMLKSIRDMSFVGSHRGNAIAAVKFAVSTLPFDPAATKIFILITVDDQLETTHSVSKEIHDVQQLLNHDGAVLYVLASYPWLERGKKVFGLRPDGLIFPTTGGESYGDFPRTPYAKMAAGTRGSIFWRSFIEENKNPFFFESLSEEMLARVQKETGRCRQCSCTMNRWSEVQTHCKPASEQLQNCG